MYLNRYLAHHGIKGQKWGVRRYQYDDGRLTPEGRKRLRKIRRYQNPDGSFTKLGYKRNRNRTTSQDPILKDVYKRASELSSKYSKDINDIYSSMSYTEKRFLSDREVKSKLIPHEAGLTSAVLRGSVFIQKHKDTPVSFLYLEYSNVVIGTNPAYQGQGYAKKNIEAAKEWLKNNPYNTKTLTWVAYRSNAKSRQLAKDSGFKENKYDVKYNLDPYDDIEYTLRREDL